MTAKTYLLFLSSEGFVFLLKAFSLVDCFPVDNHCGESLVLVEIKVFYPRPLVFGAQTD